MCPIEHPGGITVIQDDQKAPFWTIAPALEFMKDARASRKIVAIGTISDYKGNSDRRYASVARQALEVADCVVFVGPRASKCLKARRHTQDGSLRAFYSVEEARDYLDTVLRPGDVVLLKGTPADQLERLIAVRPAQEKRRAFAGEWQRPRGSVSERPAQAVVGLGNPGEQYRDTPHNVGQRALDVLARCFDSEWVHEGQALVARVERQGATILLIKPLTYVNSTGPVLLTLSRQLGFDPTDCILVQDDIDLPVGTVRVRTMGGDGGHKGMRSVLQALRTDTLRRVKIGVRPPEPGRENGADRQTFPDYLLTVFAATDMPLIERACAEAAELALRLLSFPEAVRPPAPGRRTA
jgi:aminoacyl-tRNA hydrolase